MVSQITLTLISIENEGFHLMFTAFIDKKPINILIDTGASRTVFDQTSINRILGEGEITKNEKLSTGIGTNTLESSFLELGEFCIGQHTLKKYQAVLIDMANVNQAYTMLGLPLIEGILGGDLLSMYDSVIDYQKLILKIRGRKIIRFSGR